MGYKDYDLKNPYVDEFTIGIEREIIEDLSLSVRYIRKWDRDLIEDVNASELDIDALMEDGTLDWSKNWEKVTVTDSFDNSTQTFWNQKETVPAELYTLNPPGAERDYEGIEVILNKRFSRGWALMASYVWQKSRGLIGTDFDDSWGGRGYFDDPNEHTNAVGRFPFERRHQFKLQSSLKGPWGINLSGYFRYLSGQRYTREINSVDLEVDLNQGDVTIYAEERGSRGLPDLYILDLRLEKMFRINTISFGFFADGFNIFNGNRALEVETLSSNPLRPFGEMASIQDPRIIRLGAKFEF